MDMENAVKASTAGSGGPIVVAGGGYAGLHVCLRLAAKLNPTMELTLIDRHDYHQALTELPSLARLVVWLHDVEGYTHEEIAVATGRTVSFSKSQLAHAR